MMRMISCSVLLFLLTIAIGCHTDAELSKLQEQEEKNTALVLKWLNEVNKDNFEELFDELWTRDCKQYLNSNSEPVEYEDFKQMIIRFYRDFPMTTHEVHEIFAKGDRVTAVFSAMAVHDRDSFGVPATGKELRWSAIAVFELSEGKIKTRWEVNDLLGLYQQLGMELKASK